MRGTVAPAKGSLTGPAMAAEVTRTIAEEGGEADDLVRPASTEVDRDVTVVCHGTDHGDPATFVVLVEDAKGACTLLEV